MAIPAPEGAELDENVEFVIIGEALEFSIAPPALAAELSEKIQLETVGEAESDSSPPPNMSMPEPSALPPVTVNPSRTAWDAPTTT